MKLRYCLLVALAFALFVWGAERQGRQVNTDMNSIDQDAYRDYAKNLALNADQFTGDRNRMPVYPWILARFYRANMTDEEFFARGKQVNIVITLLVLVAAFVLFRRYVPLPDAGAATLVAAFTMFVYKAPFFQAETLFYGLSFVLFVLIVELIRQPRWWVAAAAGLVGGLAHLTKASVLPAVVLGLLCLVLRALLLFWQNRATKTPDKTVHPKAWAQLIMPLACGGLFLLVFLGVLFPYISTSKARFGQYFYNVNSTFYMWYDSWDEVKAGTRAHGDRVGWPTMPADQIPSPLKYLREHSGQQILDRFGQGLDLIRNMVFTAYGYAAFLLFYALLSGLLFWQNSRRFIENFGNAAQGLVLFFIVAYFGSYLLLYAWYTRIAYGNRFILALFLPALFVLVRALGYAGRQQLAITCWKTEWPAATASAAILLMLVVYLMTTFPYQIATLYGGM